MNNTYLRVNGVVKTQARAPLFVLQLAINQDSCFWGLFCVKTRTVQFSEIQK